MLTKRANKYNALALSAILVVMPMSAVFADNAEKSANDTVKATPVGSVANITAR